MAHIKKNMTDSRESLQAIGLCFSIQDDRPHPPSLDRQLRLLQSLPLCGQRALLSLHLGSQLRTRADRLNALMQW